MPTPALSAEVRARPELQLIAGALVQPQGRSNSPLIQVPPSPISADTLKALQQTSQQFAVRDQSPEAQAAEAPARELKQALASVTRSSTVTTPDVTTTKIVETPGTTTTTTVSETVTVPGPESAGVQELRGVLGRAAARAGTADDRGDGRASDRTLSRLTNSVERAGDRLLDSLDALVNRGGNRLDRRADRALDTLGETFVRTIDRLFDRGGDRGVSAFEQVLQDNGARVVATLGKVLEATGDRVSKSLEDLLVKAGPEVINALQATVDRVRPTTTQTVTHEETVTTPSTFQTVTTTTPGSTVTTTNAQTVTPPPTPSEARAEVRRQVEAYSSASNLVAPLQQLASPPPAVPNPQAIVDTSQTRDIQNRFASSDRGPIVRDNKDQEDRRGPLTGSGSVQEIRLRPPLVNELASSSSADTSLAPPINPPADSTPGSLVQVQA